MSNRRYIAAREGRPVLEVLSQPLFDTKELPEHACSMLTFFLNPAQYSHLSNMQASGQLPNPQRFHVTGIGIELLSVDTDGFVINREKEVQRQQLFEACWFEFVIGAKPYLDIPVTRFFQNAIPQDHHHKVISRFFGPRNVAPEEFKEKLDEYKDAPLQVIIGDLPEKDFMYDITVYKGGRPLRVVVTDRPRNYYYYDLTVPVGDKKDAIEIPPQQAFKATFTWESTPSYDMSELGTVLLRVYLEGYKWREVQ